MYNREKERGGRWKGKAILFLLKAKNLERKEFVLNQNFSTF
jgi:hypothetical protein